MACLSVPLYTLFSSFFNLYPSICAFLACSAASSSCAPYLPRRAHSSPAPQPRHRGLRPIFQKTMSHFCASTNVPLFSGMHGLSLYE